MIYVWTHSKYLSFNRLIDQLPTTTKRKVYFPFEYLNPLKMDWWLATDKTVTVLIAKIDSAGGGFINKNTHRHLPVNHTHTQSQKNRFFSKDVVSRRISNGDTTRL